jgi:hypothetical protein
MKSGVSTVSDTKARATEANLLGWNINELFEQNAIKTVNFDVPIQRGYVWDNKRCSLLIHSILLGIPISEFYFSKTENGIYEGLEGKQRNKAICDYLNNLYKLHAGTPSVKLKDGTEVSIARHTFDKLPSELQNRIRMFQLRMFWFDNPSTDDKILIFTRINSGKPVTAADIARLKVKSKKIFLSLVEHQAISLIVREKSKLKFTDEDIVEDIWILANFDNTSLYRYRATLLEKNDVTDVQHRELIRAFDYMLAFYKSIENDKKLTSKLRAKTHITLLGYMGVLAVRNKISENKFIEKAATFFSDAYNAASLSGSSKPEHMQDRMKAVRELLGV